MHSGLNWSPTSPLNVSESSSTSLAENPTPGSRLGVTLENCWKSRQISPLKMNDSEKLDFLVTMVTNINAGMDNMEQRIKSLEEEFLDVREKLNTWTDASHGNSRSLVGSVEELRSALNDTRKETANLIRHAIAKESFEKASEEKNVAVFNITDKQISPFRNPEIKERGKNSEEAVKSFLNKLAHDTVKDLGEEDIESIRPINQQTRKGVHSAVVSFVSVGDAQKFNARINSRMKSKIVTRRRENTTICSRLGLTMLQRNLLATTDFITEQEDSQGIQRRPRNSKIRELANWEALWTSIEFKKLEVLYVDG